MPNKLKWRFMNASSYWAEHENVNICTSCENLIINLPVCVQVKRNLVVLISFFVIYAFNQRWICHLHLFFCRFLVTIARYWGRSGSSPFSWPLVIKDTSDINSERFPPVSCPYLQRSVTMKYHYNLSLNILF